MEPNSVTLVVLLILASAGAVVGAIMLRPVLVKVVGGLLAMTLSATAGIAIVNDYYGYYQTWAQMSADLSGDYSHYAPTAKVSRDGSTMSYGQLKRVDLPGPHSGIDRKGLVYLPPQYFQPKYAHTTFPVVELVHGTPGNPYDWVVHLDIINTMDELISKNLVGPMILVIPTMSEGHPFQECVDAPGALDDTYMTEDIRQDILTHFRASPVSAEWGIAGYSSGGYCAANLSLRHRAEFGAAGIMDGYFRPEDGPAAQALHHDKAAEDANDPLEMASQLARGAAPLASFWLAAGTGDVADVDAAEAFVAALHGVEDVPLTKERGASHNFYAWRPLEPQLLSWMWTQLAPPELRVQFPIAEPTKPGKGKPTGKPSGSVSDNSTPPPGTPGSDSPPKSNGSAKHSTPDHPTPTHPASLAPWHAVHRRPPSPTPSAS